MRLTDRASSRIREIDEETNAHTHGDPSPSRDTDEIPGRAVDRVTAALRRDIYCGRLPVHVLHPSSKTVCSRYATSYRTLKKAMQRLCNEGVLSALQRGFRIPHVQPHSSGYKVVFVCRGTPQGDAVLSGINDMAFRTLEAECTKRQCRLVLCLYYFDAHNRVVFRTPHRDRHDIAKEANVLGFCALVRGPADRHEEALRILSHTGKRIAILDITGGWHRPWFLRKAHIRTFTVATSARCGMDTARFFLSQGHTRIAYLSPFHKAHWSKKRLSGLQKVYRDAGVSHGVKAFCIENPPIIHTFFEEKASTQSNYDACTRFYHRWRRRLPQAYTCLLDEWFLKTLPQKILPQGEFLRGLQTLFDAARSDTRITAWVAANDQVALYALQYLHTHAIACPHTVSLCGFDDTHDASLKALTSYNFNIQETARLLFVFLASGSLLPAHRSARPIEISGMITERETTRILPDPSQG
jgi:hypothetical protein